MPRTLRGRTLLISGGSRGIGRAIAVRAARDGANVTLLAKTDQPDPRLDGTVHMAAAAVEAAGGRALPIVGDIRDDAAIDRAISETVAAFGGIDIVVNNASALDLRKTAEIDLKGYDLMQDINARGTFALSRAALPHLRASDRAHILTLSPPLNLEPKWAGAHLAYTIAKYGMSLCTLGLAEELRDRGIAVNSLWPRTLIATAAVRNRLGGDAAIARSRRPEIVADAAHAILARDPPTCTGQFLIDEDVLRAEGGAVDGYHVVPGDGELELDGFLPGAVPIRIEGGKRVH